ncbi:TPA: hypothetical protein N0F65_006809 [Lagenidium giganteum]|uniref:Protein kinase domain-containing protein n=1 Tax=Lagenidium giganteum TaxID=4803 RepID=A0AAV2ZCD5_9STRA|nr:TPA: hypothetical protein N0F65_006809 [Lagenidium giganteum]
MRSEEAEIPIKLSLGGAALTLTRAGQWELGQFVDRLIDWLHGDTADTVLQEYIDRCNALTDRVEVLQKENAMLREKHTRMTEESNMEKFKCQLLVEMASEISHGAVQHSSEESERARISRDGAPIKPLEMELCLRARHSSRWMNLLTLCPALAISSLDEERSKQEAEQEKARASSLRGDILRLMEQARKEGVDVRRLASEKQTYDPENPQQPEAAYVPAVPPASSNSRQQQPPRSEPRPARTESRLQQPANGKATNGNGPNSNGAPNRRRTPPKSGVHFGEFEDREKTVVETMLESNRGLRMAEINFNDLKLQKIIGAGAFGEVIKGTYCGTPVVVKRMLRNKIDENNMRMFGEEIQLMMNLRHPNIVQFIGASWNSYSNICFVTEFLERGDLFAVLRNPQNKLSWVEPLLRMAIDTSRGMAYLHSMNPPIIHRDLKSMNILVSSTWCAKVSDFGLSREKATDETMSVTGTPLWLPPEMIRGERYTEKADVYSFGIVLAEMDTRKIPYHDVKPKGASKKKVSGSTLMHMVAYQNLRPSLSANCMKSVRELYDRCTSDDQSFRPTFEEIVQILENQVRKETLLKASEAAAMASLEEADEDTTPEELGVVHVTKYTD